MGRRGPGAERDPRDPDPGTGTPGGHRRLPLRVHLARRLRRPARRRGRQRRHAAAPRQGRRLACARGSGRGRAVRHDGRARDRDPERARRRRTPGRRDLLVQLQVRLGLLRAVPRRGWLGAQVGRPQGLPARSGQRARGRARGAARCRRGRGRAHGKARDALPRSHRARARRLALAARRVSGLRRVRDARGRRGGRRPRPPQRDPRVADCDPPSRSRPRHHVLGERGGGVAGLTLDATAAAAANERGALAATLLAAEARRGGEVWGPLCGEPCAAGMEAIYEGYLLHYGQPRLFAPRDDGERLLCGDHLYAQGLVWIAATGDLAAIDALATLIGTAAAVRARGDDDNDLWAATALALAGVIDYDGLARAARALRLESDTLPIAALVAGRDVVEAQLAHARLAAQG